MALQEGLLVFVTAERLISMSVSIEFGSHRSMNEDHKGFGLVAALKS